MRILKLAVPFVSIMVAGLFTACRPSYSVGNTEGVGTPVTSDTWLRESPSHGGTFELISRANIAQVVASQRAVALSRLETNSWSVLSGADAKLLTDGRLGAGSGTGTYVLLRCVVPELGAEDTRQADSYRIEWRSGAVTVRSMNVRARFMAFQHEAIVALLPAAPSDVFIEEATAIQ